MSTPNDGPGPEHLDVQECEEHGQLWQSCLDCGAQWCLDSGEQVTEGDGTCLELAYEAERK